MAEVHRHVPGPASRTVLTVVGLGTAAVAGAAIALAVTTPPAQRSAAKLSRDPRPRVPSASDSSYALEEDGSGLFV